jgi:hypothetical protein
MAIEPLEEYFARPEPRAGMMWGHAPLGPEGGWGEAFEMPIGSLEGSGFLLGGPTFPAGGDPEEYIPYIPAFGIPEGGTEWSAMATIEKLMETESLGVLASIAGGPAAGLPSTGGPPSSAPLGGPAAGTMPPTPIGPSPSDPYASSSGPPVGLTSAMLSESLGGAEIGDRLGEPSFDGGGGLLCDPVTGECPTYR